jgi:hypothetical protein
VIRNPGGDAKHRSHRNHAMRPIRLLAALPAASLAAYVWLAPGYIELDIPVARHKGGGDFWMETHRTRLAYADSAGLLFVHRQVGSTSDAHDWKTAADVFGYFEEQLRRHGWVLSTAGNQDAIAPESRLLGADNHKQYWRPGDQSHTAYLTLSVWPSRGSADHFNVALTTANPSLVMRLSGAFD